MSTKSDYYDWRRLPLSLKLQLAEKRIVELEASLAAARDEIISVMESFERYVQQFGLKPYEPRVK